MKIEKDIYNNKKNQTIKMKMILFKSKNKFKN
jgi:hypothetical protein